MAFVAKSYRLTHAGVASAPLSLIVPHEKLDIAMEVGALVEAGQVRRNEIITVAQSEADTIIGNAKAEADNIVAQANQQAESILAEAHAKAEASIAEGSAKAEEIEANAASQAEKTLADAQAAAQDTITQATANAEFAVWEPAKKIFEEVTAARDAFAQNVEGLLAGLLADAVNHILSTLSDDDKIMACVRHVMQASQRETDATLHVHSSDVDRVSGQLGTLPWTIKADDGLNAGECRLISPKGEWRASFSSLEQRLRSWAAESA